MVEEVIKINNSKEFWKPVKGFPDYEASNFGKIRNINTKHVLKEYVSNSGYYEVSVYLNGKAYPKTVHRLIAQTFMSQYDDQKNVINHIDSNRLNNNLLNLEWCSSIFNTHEMQNRVGIKTKKARDKLKQVSKKPVYQLDNEHNIIHKYNSIKEASYSVHHSYNASHITRALKTGIRAYGYYWKYVNEESSNRGSFKDSPKHLKHLAKVHSSYPQVRQYDLDHKLIRKYPNRFKIHDYIKSFNLHSFQECINHNRKTYLGYYWKEK